MISRANFCPYSLTPGAFYFAFFNEDTPLAPLTQSSVVREALGDRKGESFWPGEVPTSGKWEQLRVKAYGAGGEKKGEDGHTHEELAGRRVTYHQGSTVQARREKEARRIAV